MLPNFKLFLFVFVIVIVVYIDKIFSDDQFTISANGISLAIGSQNGGVPWQDKVEGMQDLFKLDDFAPKVDGCCQDKIAKIRRNVITQYFENNVQVITGPVSLKNYELLNGWKVSLSAPEQLDSFTLEIDQSAEIPKDILALSRYSVSQRRHGYEDTDDITFYVGQDEITFYYHDLPCSRFFVSQQTFEFSLF